MVNFLNKWGIFLKKEFIQWIEDSQETLKAGVCYGMTYNLLLYIHKHPNISLEEVAESLVIQPQDDFHRHVMLLKFILMPKNYDAPMIPFWIPYL